MPPLPADFSHARPCKPFCEKYLTLPVMLIGAVNEGVGHELVERQPWRPFTTILWKSARLAKPAVSP